MNVRELYGIYKQHQIICTDTRKLGENCLFFALKGDNFNANAFAAAALDRGAAYAIIDEASYKKDERYLLVDDVLNTLQELATYHRTQLHIPVIAIAGSNGKTTTKELMKAVLGEKFNVLSTPGNLNNHIGLPLSVLQITTEHELAIIEMGANHIGENEFLCNIAQPTMGLVTNNGKDHLEGFGSLEGVAKSNSELYYYLLKNKGLVFLNAHDEWLQRMATRLKDKKTYAANFEGRKINADYSAFASQLRPEIIFTLEGEKEEIKSCLNGDYNFDNIMAAVAMGLYFGLNAEQVKKGIEGYVPSNFRSQVIKKEGNTIYFDAYNANPSSMEASIKNFAAMPFENKVLVLGDMFELGDYAKKEHQAIVDLCAQLQLKEVFLAGKDFYITQCSFRKFETSEELVEYFSNNRVKGKNIFMKGSRGMKLESLLELIP